MLPLDVLPPKATENAIAAAPAPPTLRRMRRAFGDICKRIPPDCCTPTLKLWQTHTHRHPTDSTSESASYEAHNHHRKCGRSPGVPCALRGRAAPLFRRRVDSPGRTTATVRSCGRDAHAETHRGPGANEACQRTRRSYAQLGHPLAESRGWASDGRTRPSDSKPWSSNADALAWTCGG